jgi:hypothetical protein
VSSGLLNAKITVDQKAINRIVTNLRRTQSRDFLESLNLGPEAQSALRFLKQHFPRSTQRTPGSRRELGLFFHLVEGWHVQKEVMPDGVGFAITHSWGDVDRVRTILNSLNSGSRAWIWEAKKDTRFIIQEPRTWVHFGQGTQMPMKSRPGLHYVEDTLRYVQDVLLPKVRKKIDAGIQETMNQ